MEILAIISSTFLTIISAFIVLYWKTIRAAFIVGKNYSKLENTIEALAATPTKVVEYMEHSQKETHNQSLNLATLNQRTLNLEGAVVRLNTNVEKALVNGAYLKGKMSAKANGKKS